MDTVIQDIRYALRSVAKNRLLTVMVVLVLSIGIGASTAIFSLVNAVVLRPLPFKEPERLVKIDQANPKLTYGFVEGATFRQLEQWRGASTTLEDIAAYNMASHDLVGAGAPQRLWTLEVSDNFFSLLGTSPLLGRTLMRDDFEGERRVLVISYRLWQSVFAGAGDVVGKQVYLTGRPYVVVGVMPPRFRYPPAILQVPGMNFEAWEPIPRQSPLDSTIVIGRLAENATIAQAKAELDTLIRGQNTAHRPGASEWSARVNSVSEEMTAHLRPAMWLLLGAVVLMLLISCVNVANLLLARASGRARETALRRALGAGRGRLLRQWLTESLLLSGIGTVIGMLWANWAIQAVIPLFPHGIPRVNEIGVDGTVLAFGIAAAVLSSLVFGIPPAAQAARIDVYESLKGSGTTAGASRGSSRWLSALVVSEVALSVVLLVGAGLLLRSVRELLHVDLGFRPDNVLTMRLALSPQRYASWEQARAFHSGVLERLRRLPGANSAAFVMTLPLSGRSVRQTVALEPRKDPNGEELYAEFNIVTPEYFRAMGIPLLKGRLIEEGDVSGTLPVAVISRAAAQRFWPDEDPIGKRINTTHSGMDQDIRTVVGVVETEKQWGLAENPDPKVYVPYAQLSGQAAESMLRILTFAVIRTTADPSDMAAAARQAVWDVDPDQPVVELKSMRQLVDDSIAGPRLQSLLLGSIAGVALLLASLGIYGVLTHVVSRRTQEIGVRLALGAGRRDVLQAVLLRGMMPVLLGSVVGLVAAVGVTRLMTNQLFGVGPLDPFTYAAVAVILVCVAFLACFPTAWRATKIDPIVALRCE